MERKKIKNKAKKSELRSKAETLDFVEKGEKKVEDDPYGTKFVVGVDHLAEATKFLTPLLSHAGEDIEILELGCRVFQARSKKLFYLEKLWLLLRSLFKIEKHNPDSPLIHLHGSNLAILLENAEIDAPLKELLLEETRSLLKHDGSRDSIMRTNDLFLSSNNLGKVVTAAKVLLVLEPEPPLPSALSKPSSLIEQFDLKVCLFIMSGLPAVSKVDREGF